MLGSYNEYNLTLGPGVNCKVDTKHWYIPTTYYFIKREKKSHKEIKKLALKDSGLIISEKNTHTQQRK